MQYIGSEARLRNAYVDQLISSTVDAVGSLQLPSEMYGEVVTIEDLLANAYAPDVRHDLVVLDPSAEPDAVPIIPLRRGEHVKLGAEFTTQSERQREMAVQAARKLFTGAKPEVIVDGVMQGMQDNAATQGFAGEFGVQNGVAAMTTSITTIFSKKVALEAAGVFGIAGQFAIGQVLARTAMFVPIEESGDQLPVLVHELEHYVDKQSNPMHVYYSQNDIDDRGLRTELKAYFAGAEATPNGTNNIQTEVEAIRHQLNGDGRQKFRPHPDFFRQAAQHGITRERMVHGGIDFQKYARAMRQHQAPTAANPFIK